MSTIYDWSEDADKNSGSDELIEWREGQKPNTVNNSARSMMKRIREYLHDTGGTCEGVLTLGKGARAGTVIRIKTQSTMKEYKDGTVIRFVAVGHNSHSINTDGTTILLGNLPPSVAYIATKDGIQPLSGGEIFAGSVYTIVYRATGAHIGWHVLNPTRVLLEELHRPKRLPAGMIMNFGMREIPEGWLPCDGRAYKRWDYPYLFARIGLAWGEGDGETTFNVPDLRGVFVRGASLDHPFATYEADLLQSYQIQGRAEEYDPNREVVAVEVPAEPVRPVPDRAPEPAARPPVVSPYDAPMDEKTKVLSDIVQWALINQNALYTPRRHYEAVDKLKAILRNREAKNETLKGIMRWAKKQPVPVLQDMTTDLLSRRPVREVHKAAFSELEHITKPVFKARAPAWHHRFTTQTRAGLTTAQKLDELIMRGLYGWRRGSSSGGIDFAGRPRKKRSMEHFLYGMLAVGAGLFLWNLFKKKRTREMDLDVQYIIGGDPAMFPIFKYPHAPIYFDNHGYLMNPNTCRRVSSKSYIASAQFALAKKHMVKTIVYDPNYPEPCSPEDSACVWGFIRGRSCDLHPYEYQPAKMPIYIDTETSVYFDSDGYLMNPNTCMRTSKKAYPEYLAKAKVSTLELFHGRARYFNSVRDPVYPFMCGGGNSVCVAPPPPPARIPPQDIHNGDHGDEIDLEDDGEDGLGIPDYFAELGADDEDKRRRKRQDELGGSELVYSEDNNPFQDKYPDIEKQYGTEFERTREQGVYFTKGMKDEIEGLGRYPESLLSFLRSVKDSGREGTMPYYTNSLFYFDSMGYVINPNTQQVIFGREGFLYRAAFEQAKEYTEKQLGAPNGLTRIQDSRYPVRTAPPRPPAPEAPDDDDDFEFVWEEDDDDVDVGDISTQPAYPIHMMFPERPGESPVWYDDLGYSIDPMTCLRHDIEEDRKVGSRERLVRANHARNQTGLRLLNAIRFYNLVGEDFPSASQDPIHKPPKEEDIMSDDLRKEYLGDLKKLLQHKHHFVSDRIGGIETRPVNVAVNFAIKV